MKWSQLRTIALAGACLLAARASAQDRGAEGGAPGDLTAAYFDLEHEYGLSMDAWRELVTGWRNAAPEERGELPSSPAPAFFPRFAELAEGGHGRARLWCVQNFTYSGIEPARAYAALTRLCLELVTEHGGEEWAGEIVTALARQASEYPGYLGRTAAFGLMDELAARSSGEDVRAGVLFEQGRALERSDDEQLVARAKALYRRLVDEHPEHENGRRAAGYIFRDEHLQIGMAAPDFLSRDIDGNELRLSDYRGRVVVIDFWGFW